MLTTFLLNFGNVEEVPPVKEVQKWYGFIDCGDLIITRSGTNALQILSKPRASYTNAARNNQTTGAVRLRVTFLASGEIGNVTPVSSLPDGLTEEAIDAAKNITFNPATKDGKPVTVTKLIEYSFSIY